MMVRREPSVFDRGRDCAAPTLEPEQPSPVCRNGGVATAIAPIRHLRPARFRTEAIHSALLAEFDERSAVRELNLVWNEAAALPHADDTLHAILGRVTENWDDQITIGVLRCMAEGSIGASLPPRDVARLLTTALEGLSQRWLAGLLDAAEAQTAMDSLLARLSEPRAAG
jgi:hypothetical protein